MESVRRAILSSVPFPYIYDLLPRCIRHASDLCSALQLHAERALPDSVTAWRHSEDNRTVRELVQRYERSIEGGTAHRSGIIVGKDVKKGIFPRRYIGLFQYRDPVLKEFQTTLSEWLRLMRSQYKVR